MDRIWVVYNDADADVNIVGVFDNQEDAENYAEEIGRHFVKGLLAQGFPVPYRMTDRGTRIVIS